MELINAAFSAPNILLTILFILVVFYWMTVIVGALNVDSFDIDVDVDVDVDIDVDIDADVDVDAETEVSGGGGANWFFGLLRFFNFGRVPFMVVMSILILSMWSISMLCNHEGSPINPGNSFILAALYFIPNLIASAFVMKFISTPLIPIFDKLDTHAQALQYEGQIGILTTDIKENGLGQLKLFVNNSSIVISVKSANGLPIPRGQKVVVVEELSQEKCYIVSPTSED